MEIWRLLNHLNAHGIDDKTLLPKVSRLLRLKLRCNINTPSAIVGYRNWGSGKFPVFPSHQWVPQRREIKLEDRHLCWVIVCIERDILGQTADPVREHDGNTDHLAALDIITRVLQDHVK